jgi:hypothetical protein
MPNGCLDLRRRCERKRRLQGTTNLISLPMHLGLPQYMDRHPSIPVVSNLETLSLVRAGGVGLWVEKILVCFLDPR